MRVWRWGMALLATLSFSGCISITTVVHVEPDGSGTVTETTLLQPAMVEMMQGFASMAEDQGGAPPELFTEKDLRAKAEGMGPGVTFVSSRKIKEPGGEGVEAVYAFKNVNTLRIQEKPTPPGPGAAPEEAKEDGGPQFAFTRLPNGNALLTVLSKTGTKGEPSSPTPDPAAEQERPRPSAEQMEQAKEMLQGLRIAVIIDAGQRVVRTNSPFVKGTRVTLLELDFDALLDNPKKLEALMAMGEPESLDAAKRLLKDVPGVKVSLDPKIEIEFQ